MMRLVIIFVDAFVLEAFDLSNELELFGFELCVIILINPNLPHIFY